MLAAARPLHFLVVSLRLVRRLPSNSWPRTSRRRCCSARARPVKAQRTGIVVIPFWRSSRTASSQRRTTMRRRSILTGAAMLPAFAIVGRHSALGSDPIKIGLIEDVSGDLAMMGMPKLHGSELAVEEINAKGGVLGRQIVLSHLDPQGDNARYQEFARRLLQRDKVDLLIGGITSASREAVRPIVGRQNVLYFYTNQYEGGVCDASMVSVGAVPEQQLSTLIPWMVERYGKRVYTIAADYNFGPLSAEWGRTILNPLNGEIVGEEFIPLGVSQF